ncbi:MAG: V-type ATP synthase subunit A, partial [Clostridia bacterium]|nr:V-type ATP synthase subunit A [Clostridia bacterium]
MNIGTVKKVAGPLVIASGMKEANMFDVVKVGKEKLIGEIIEMHSDKASIQIYEETSGLGPGAEVISTGEPLSVELGPGLIGSIFDGIQRPLDEIMKISGNNLQRGVETQSLNREKKWHFRPSVAIGDAVEPGDILGEVEETEIISHKIMVPYGVQGEIHQIAEDGEYT